MSDTTIHQPLSQPSNTKILTDAVVEAGNGLSGWMKQIANMTAVGVIAFLVIMMQRDATTQAHMDRELFQKSIEELRRSQESRWKNTEEVHGRSVEALGVRMDRACTSLERATAALERKN
jgi:hypothetical protein